MQRCIQLAGLAIGDVAPNPMVGAVLVHQDKVIGEGYHQQYGGPHAEVVCIASVKEEHRHLISSSILYVSLEPCAHWGKTPPCADLIIENKIPQVVVGCRDLFVQVNGKGIDKLKAAGINVTIGVLEEECKKLNKRFFTFHQERRPYIILKWAETGDGKMAAALPPERGLADAQHLPVGESVNEMGSLTGEVRSEGLATPPLGGRGAGSRLYISNDYTSRMVHKWRSEEAAILVGTNTALYDNPQLNTRLSPGKNPVRIVVDMNLRLPQTLNVFDGTVPTIIFNKHQHSLPIGKTDPHTLTGLHYYQITEDVSLVHQLLNGLFHLNIQSILVEGGAQLLQSFIDEGVWDEARIIRNESLIVGEGLSAPKLLHHSLEKTETIFFNTLFFYRNTKL